MEGQSLKKEPELSGLENSQSVHITTDTKACSGESPKDSIRTYFAEDINHFLLINHLSRSQHRVGVDPFDFTSTLDSEFLRRIYMSTETLQTWTEGYRDKTKWRNAIKLPKVYNKKAGWEDEVMSASVDPKNRAPVVFISKEMGTNNTFTVESAVPSQSVEVGGLLPLPEHGATPWDPKRIILRAWNLMEFPLLIFRLAWDMLPFIPSNFLLSECECLFYVRMFHHCFCKQITCFWISLVQKWRGIFPSGWMDHTQNLTHTWFRWWQLGLWLCHNQVTL